MRLRQLLPSATAALAILSTATSFAASSDNPMDLWYAAPAKAWTEALPVGNGHMGAMIFGGVGEERLQLNENTLWAGSPYNPVNPKAKAALPEVRRLVSEGKYKEAEALIDTDMMAVPRGQMPYQTVGNLRLAFDHAEGENYWRDLNLETATASVGYSVGEVHYQREIFASAPDEVIVIRLTTDRPGSLSFHASMDTSMEASVTTNDYDTLILQGRGGDLANIPGKVWYQARARILATGGTTLAEGNTISVEGADAVTILVSAATNYRNYKSVNGDPEALVKRRLNDAARKSYAELRSRHLADYQELFNRVTLDLGHSDAVKLPTDERIRRFADGNDPQLAALYYQFGRYLLISSSRPGGQPANLQGLWNEFRDPPWQSKYTININTEMNYWPAESGNLGECIDPLISMVRELSVTGAVTAREMYGANGWVAHHNTDLWRASAPIDGPRWGMWPTGGAWLCLHLWDRYEYSGDRAVLEKVYPLMKGSAEFFLDTLQKDPKHGWLVTNPSLSPENEHPFGTSICAGPTMDMQILRDLFANTISAARILGVDEDFQNRLTSARERLAPNQIGANGQLQEWMEDWDMQAPERNHRHISHLYGLFPGHDISTAATPELAAAARKSLEIRGDESTGWATAWRICLWAHLRDGDHAYKVLQYLLSPDRTYPDMFDAHPPFQIDGNFGGAAGIVEMLMQSGDGTIVLLPSLPKAWPEGNVKGLMARGGYEVDIAWKDGQLTEAVIRSTHGGSVKLRYGGAERDLTLAAKASFRWEPLKAE
jgi:alpha-L-fucosidase 2